MKFNCYVCECGCHFTIEDLTDSKDPSCPNCGNDMTVDSTGECIRDPKIEFDKDDD